jgi:DNA-binding response OmpR family regulator
MTKPSASGFRTRARIVLFVEDNADLREMYSQALRDGGLYVAQVATVDEAILVASRLLPDVVVLDRGLHDGDGWDVARALKSTVATKDAQILAFTACRGRDDVERALVAGCDAFLEKPCTPDHLVRMALALSDVSNEEEERLKLA